MEVHHHPHVEKKNFKEYFLEFLMIFLAVTLGFFAESIRESISDSVKEKEYIVSMIEDAKTDTLNISNAIASNRLRALHLDSLVTLCMSYTASANNDADIYRLYRYGMVHPAFISPTERTIMQLKNAGGMRLIRKKAAVDSIVLYDDAAKKLADQQAYYELYQNKSIEPATKLFNFQKFGFRSGIRDPLTFSKTDSSLRLLDNDKIKLVEFANYISIYEGIVNFYLIRLQEMNEHAAGLIESLKKAYHLEND
jgi:hypothetical protein